jgi:cytochrome P450
MREVRNKFKSVSDIRMGPRLNSCVYLRACIDEALRMAPPAGGTLWREVDEGGAVIDGIPIPAGYDVGIAVHSLHHNPTYFPRPWSYDPNRWLRSGGDKSSVSTEAMTAAYNPFGHGPRSCIGKPLALQELMLTLATLFYQYDFCPAGRDEDAWKSKDMVPEPFLLKDHVSGQKTGPFVRFRLRGE